MHRQFSISPRLRCAILALACLVGTPSASLAQGSSATMMAAGPAQKAATESTESDPERLAEARAQLEQATQDRKEAARRAAGRNHDSRQADKQRLLDWLVDLQGEKVKRLEDLHLRNSRPEAPVENDPLVQALGGPPPYSAVRIDVVRDEIDGLKESRTAAEASYRANQTEMQNLQSELRTRAAAVRRATDRMSDTARRGASPAHDDAELAQLLHRVTEVELSIVLLDQEALKARIANLSARIQGLTSIVGRVLPQQALSPDDRIAQQQRVMAEQNRLAKEIAEAGRLYIRHSRARDQLVESDRLPGNARNEQAALLDLAIKTDNATRKGLDDLQVLTSLSWDSWDRRYVLLAAADAEQRRVALAGLQEVRQKLTDWRNLSHTRQETLRTEIREQRMRMAGLSREVPARRLEEQRLDLLLQQAAIAERVELAATRLERQVSRWLGDVDAGQGGNTRWTRLHEQIADGLTRIWNQELFVAEDISEVDGRRVPIQYSVTVGKSIGMIAVFVLGYGIFSRVARFIQMQLVNRLKISSQLASVVRRWTTIVFAIGLVVLVLNLARIPLSVFAFLGGALAIGVGFGAQTIIKNFISGLIVLFERQIRIGDIVELGGVTGHVTAVDLRATTVRSFTGVEALMPNANFIESQVINWTYSNRKVRHEIKVGIAYGSNLARVEALFLAAAVRNSSVLRDPEPEFFVEDFGDSAITVALVYWVELENPISPRRVASELRVEIFGRLAEADVTIPFPQREVRVAFAGPQPQVCYDEVAMGAVNGS